MCLALDVPENKKLGIVTYHPVTLEKDKAGLNISELLEALKDFPDIFWIITLPNADTGGRVIIEMIENFVRKNSEKVKSFASLGQSRYLSLLKHAVVMAGNSSSGLIEAPSFGLPVVNIGDRQHGRIRAENVIDVQECNKRLVTDAIKRAVSMEFKGTLNDMRNPYGDEPASEKIVGQLKTAPLDKYLLKKGFTRFVLNKDKLNSLLILADTTIKQAMQKLSDTQERILFVVDNNKKLLGTINDGDIRRALINGSKFDYHVGNVMHKSFVSVDRDVADIEGYSKKLMLEKRLSKFRFWIKQE